MSDTNTEIQHLEDLITARRQNLRRFQRQAANYPSSEIPLQLQNQMAEEEAAIQRFSQAIEVLRERQRREWTEALVLPDDQVEYSIESSNNDYETNSNNGQVVMSADSFGIPSPGVVLVILFAIAIIFAAGSSCSYQGTVKVDERFALSEGLGAWRSTGVASNIQEDRTDRPDRDNSTSNSTLRGSVQLGPGAILYRNVNTSRFNSFYEASVWCKAPEGAKCVLFISTLENGLNKVFPQNDQVITRDGTGKWESMQVSWETENEVSIYIFLYNNGTGSVVYDDVLVRQTR